MLMGALECGSSRISSHAFGAAGLLGWLTGAPAEVRPTPRRSDTRTDRPSLRAGGQSVAIFDQLSCIRSVVRRRTSCSTGTPAPPISLASWLSAVARLSEACPVGWHACCEQALFRQMARQVQWRRSSTPAA